MRIRYIVPIANKRKVIIPDHWDFSVLGGVFHVIEENGFVAAVEIVYHNQSTDLSPTIEQLGEGEIKCSITGRDDHLPFIRIILNDAMSFLQCYFGIGLSLDDVDVKYEGESPEEEDRIAVKSMKVGKYEQPLFLTFDMLTRAVMASEKGAGPKFESALISAARDALSEQRFIDSFRYSFLLIEFIYGNGQFKGSGLKDALRSSPKLRSIIERILVEDEWVKDEIPSDTLTILSGSPSVDDLISHFVDKRGFYFHGNIKRKDTWKPEQQGEAKVLAFVAIDIVSSVAQQAAITMFDETLNKRHFEYAKKAGALIVFQVKYAFRIPGESFSHDGQLNIQVPGTKVTPKVAFGVAQHFLQHFEHQLPTAGLDHVECTVQGNGQKVFDMKFHNES